MEQWEVVREGEELGSWGGWQIHLTMASTRLFWSRDFGQSAPAGGGLPSLTRLSLYMMGREVPICAYMYLGRYKRPLHSCRGQIPFHLQNLQITDEIMYAEVCTFLISSYKLWQ